MKKQHRSLSLACVGLVAAYFTVVACESDSKPPLNVVPSQNSVNSSTGSGGFGGTGGSDGGDGGLGGGPGGMGGTPSTGGSGGAGGDTGGMGGAGGGAPTKPSEIWSYHSNQKSEQVASAVAVDDLGNVYVAGHFTGFLSLGDTLDSPLSSADVDAFLISIDKDGNTNWMKKFGETDDQMAVDVAIDDQGGIILVGEFVDTIDFGGGPIVSTNGSTDIFVARFDVDGNYVSAEQYGNQGKEHVLSVSVDPIGNMLLTGSFNNAIDFEHGGEGGAGAGTALESAGGDDVFIVKFAANGDFLWNMSFGDVNDQVALAVATDSAGASIITGRFEGVINFGAGALTTGETDDDMFVAKFDAAGDHVWSTSYGDDSDQVGLAVTVDANNNPVLVGQFEGSIIFGSAQHDAPGNKNNGFVLKLAANDGSALWSHAFGDDDEQSLAAVAVDSNDDVLVTGLQNDDADYGGGILSSGGDDDVVLAKFDTAGLHIWSGVYGDMAADQGLAIATDSLDNILLAGTFTGDIDFGAGPKTAGDMGKAIDAFIAKLEPAP